MAKNKKGKSALSGIFGCFVIAVMIIIFIYQQIVPANFGEEFDHLTKNAASINVAFTHGTEGGNSYFTDDQEKVKEFREYIDDIKLRYRTLGDTMSANKTDMDRIIFAVVDTDGNIYSFQIDEKGLVQFNTRVFKVGESFKTFWDDTLAMAKTWEKTE